MGLISDVAYVLGAITAVLIAFLVLLSLPTKAIWRIFSVVSVLNLSSTLIPVGFVEIIGLSGFLRRARSLAPLFRRAFPLLLFALIIVSLVAYPSSPDPNGAVFVALGLIAMIGSIALASGAAQQGLDIVRLTVLPIAPIAVVQAISTVVFRLSPELEETYLRSSLAGFLLGDDAHLLYTTRPNNVTDPLKAGGVLFVNGNRASMVMAVLALLYLSLWVKRRTVTLFALFAICFAGGLATSSKTALVLSISIPLTFLILPNAIRAGRQQGTAVLGVIALAAIGIGLWTLSSKLPTFIVGADEATASRSAFYTGWAAYFRESPFTGLGFGGWAERWARDAAGYGSSPRYPPHNFLILEWSNTGILGFLIVIALMLVLAWGYLKLVRGAETGKEGRVLSLQLGAIVWIFLHGMYDNTSFYGTVNTFVVFAALVAQMLVLTDAKAGRVPPKGSPGSTPAQTSRPRGARLEQ